MGTRWRGLLAPINTPTGDGRRFLEFSHRTLPLPLRWQRQDEMGHDTSVIVGLTDSMANLTVADAIAGGWISQERADLAGLSPQMMGAFGQGEFFDDVSTTSMPRLAEDVAESMLMAGKSIVGPSVGPGAVTFYGWVHPGTKDLITEDEYIESMMTGEPLEEEALFAAYEIAEATLVMVPAFSQTAPPFEILTDVQAALVAAHEPVPAAKRRALVAAAAVAVTQPTVPEDVFYAPLNAEYHPLTVEDRGEGFLRVHGYVAAFGVCHVGFAGDCLEPPASSMGYAPFNRFPVDAVDPDGKPTTVSVGRVTSGLGRVGTGCKHLSCRGKDDHACELASLGEAMAHYDGLRTLAYVRCTEIPGRGLYLAGYARTDLAPEERAVLARQAVSGDWRPFGDGMELIEALALAREEPGFPIPVSAGYVAGRMRSLVAAGRPRLAGLIGRPTQAPTVIDQKGLARRVADMVVADLRGLMPVTAAAGDTTDTGPAEPNEDPMPMQTGAMVALRMAADTADRLALDGGEPAAELHLTLAYLGEAADIPTDQQTALIGALRGVAAQQPGPVEGKPFAVSAFNPNSSEWDTAMVLGVAGQALPTIHQQVMDCVTGMMDCPEQHTPWVAHITLAYTDDLSMVEQMASRTGGDPIMFDTLRVAFAGANTDIPLGPAAVDPADQAAQLATEVEEALAQVEQDDRHAAAVALASEVEEVHV